MRDDAPPISRLALPRANPWRVNLRLDPSLKRSRQHAAPLPSPRAPLRSSQKRRSAAETYGMRDDAPPISRLALPRANPWRVDLRLDPSLKRSLHHDAPLPSPRASLRSSLKRRSAAEVWGMRDDAPPISRPARHRGILGQPLPCSRPSSLRPLRAICDVLPPLRSGLRLA
jgi:hypothetical protein